MVGLTVLLQRKRLNFKMTLGKCVFYFNLNAITSIFEIYLITFLSHLKQHPMRVRKIHHLILTFRVHSGVSFKIYHQHIFVIIVKVAMFLFIYHLICTYIQGYIAVS